MGEEGAVGAAIEGDLACGRCGYNLRTLPAAGRCPECGAEIAWTLQELEGRAAPAGWLNQLRRGLGIYLLAVALQVGLLLLGVFFDYLARNELISMEAWLYLRWVNSPLLSPVGTGLAIAWGAWLFTMPRPRVGGGWEILPGGRRFRMVVLLSVGWVLLNYVLSFVDSLNTNAFNEIHRVLSSIVSAALMWLLWAWVASLGRRLGMRRVALQAGILKCFAPLLVAGVVLGMIMILTGLYNPYGASSVLEKVLLFALYFMGIVLIGAKLWEMGLLIYFWTALRRAERRAPAVEGLVPAVEPWAVVGRMMRRAGEMASYHGPGEEGPPDPDKEQPR